METKEVVILALFVLQFLAGFGLAIVFYRLGVRKGKRDAAKEIIDALNIPDGCEIASIQYRKIRQ